jgi:ubiquinone/menaquinone biosynthesis C-methylase UbiE
MNFDKEFEKKRYDSKAKSILILDEFLNHSKLLGISSIKKTFRKPYQVYEELISNYINSNTKVLEIGSGIGTHSEILFKTGADVTVLDISAHSLNILNKFFSRSYNNFKTLEADMENIPVESNTFNIVVSAGSISYSDKKILKKEIYRILKPNGYFIAVDSLNDNLIYRFNRYINYIKGKRSKSTLSNMLNFVDIMKYEDLFRIKKLSFYGSITWLEPLLKILLGESKAADIINYFDKLISVKKSAFKFVIVMKKYL